MYAAIIVLTVMGAGLGLGLGYAARVFRVEADPIVERIAAKLPGSQCGQCGYPGCAPAAEAIAKGEAAVTCCPPGGLVLAEQLAEIMGVELDRSAVRDADPGIAWVEESICIGCVKCLRVCPTDAIVGAPKMIHAVLPEACSGCTKCIDICPTEALRMRPIEVTLRTWRWHRPEGETRPEAAHV